MKEATPEAVSVNALGYFGEGQHLPAETWAFKYAMRDRDGAFEETSPTATFERMATHIGAARGDPMWNLLVSRNFIPAGRILFGLGNPHHTSTLKNCYVLPIDGDNLESIFQTAAQAARVYSRGGGVGISLNPLRPKGAKVNNAAIFSSGAYSFSELYSCVTGTIGQHGRRGALMLQLSVEHPDCEDFIRMKDDVKPEWQNAARFDKDFEQWIDRRRSVRYANVSVQLTDKFLQALDSGATEFVQSFVSVKSPEQFGKTVNPQLLWDSMLHSAVNSAEPGLVFWDAIKRESPSDVYADKGYGVISTNPCGEMPLAPYDSCNLGSIHLGHFVQNSFKPDAAVQWDDLEKAVRLGVNFLDKINSIEAEEERAPLPQIATANLDLRRIGLGVMGFAEMLIRLGIVYGSEESIRFADKLFGVIAVAAYNESTNLAREHGPFRIYQWERHKSVPFLKKLPKALQDKIKRYGLRNVSILSIAPTGSIAIIGQTSGGIEPYFQFQYTRRVFKGGDEPVVYHYSEPIVDEYRKAVQAPLDSPLPPFFVSAYDIPWAARVRLQAEIQKWIDNSISSTVNLPAEATFDDAKKIYLTAWKLGCKGITVYRKGARKEVLSDGNGEAAAVLVRPTVMKEEVPALLDCKRVTFRANSHRVLLHIGIHPETLMPIELVLRHGKTDPDLDSLAQALGILASIALQEGLAPERIARTMRGIKAGWFARIKLHEDDAKPVLVTSVPDAIAVMLQRYIPGSAKVGGLTEIDGAEICEQCNHRAVVHEGGCVVCRSCGHSTCS